MTPTRTGLTLALLTTLGAGIALLGSAEADPTRSARKPTAGKQGKQPASKKGAVRWNQDLEKAKARAARLNQPLLVFQLLGDLDQEFC